MAQEADIIIDQGSDYKQLLSAIDMEDNPVDLAGYTIQSKFRSSYSANASYSLICSIEDSFSGLFSIMLYGNVSMNIPAGRYVYDIQVTDNAGNKQRVLEGTLTLTPETIYV